MKRAAIAGAIAAATTLASAPPARAQQYLPAAAAYVGSGLEGGNGTIQRARTRLRVGFELRIDEAPSEGVFAAALLDVEPHAGFGGELRYVHAFGSRVAIGAGVVGYAVPATLLGVTAGLEARAPLTEKVSFVIGPEACVYPLGSDLPDGTVVWQVLLQGGLRVDF